MRHPRSTFGLLALVAAGWTVFAGEGKGREPSGQPTTETVVAQPGYAAGGVVRFMFGRDWRGLWAEPFEVEVLDLDREAGGLEPLRRVGQLQTKGLALRGADGKAYTFRGVDKEPTRMLPDELLDTIIADLAQDQTSADLPGASVVAGPIARAAGVLQAEPRFVLMPDDPRLGELREDFAGVLGTFEEFPLPGTFGTLELIDGEEMFQRLNAGAQDRIDARAFARARLVDMLLGDWDRHVGQWRWARLPGKQDWQPVAEDRDHAFSRYDGMAMVAARDSEPKFDVYSVKYAPLEGLAWNGRGMDRRLLTGLEKSVWLEEAREVRDAITDEVIEEAFRRMPSAYFELAGDELIAITKTRRDSIVDQAERFYRFLAEQVNVYGTDRADLIVVDYPEDGAIEMTLSPARADGGDCDLDQAADAPYFRRRFEPKETREIRLYTGAGRDRVLVRGPSSGKIALRVVGGDDQGLLCEVESGETFAFDDSLQDTPGRGPQVSPGIRVAPTESLESSGTPEKPAGPAITARRDWGRTTQTFPWLKISPDYGLLLGGGVVLETFGFRRRPYSTQHMIRAGFAFLPDRFHTDYTGIYRSENRRRYWRVQALFSGIEVLNFFGFGNDTERLDDDDLYRVKSRTAGIEARRAFPLGDHVVLDTGPVARYTTTDIGGTSFISATQPYGVEDIGQVGWSAGFRFNNKRFPGLLEIEDSDDPLRWADPDVGPGYTVDVDASYYPEALDLISEYGRVRADATGTYWLTPKGTSIAFRVGGQKNWGTVPYYDAAFLGPRQVRGQRKNRFAGDASLYSNLAFRVRVGRMRLIVPGHWGISIRGDLGRVFVDEESSDTLHWAYGGGVWWMPWDLQTVFRLYYAESDEDPGLYFLMGYKW